LGKGQPLEFHSYFGKKLDKETDVDMENKTQETSRRHLVANGALAGVVYMISFVALLAVVLAGFNTREFFPAELIIVLVGLSAWFLFWGAALGVIVGSGAALASLIPRLGPLASRLIWLFFFLLYLLQLALAFRYNSYLKGAFSGPSTALVPVLFILVMASGVVVLGLNSFHPIKRLTPVLCVLLVLTSFLIVPLGLAGREVKTASAGGAGAETPHNPLNYKIILMGIDGMDWKFADALLAEGKMPNLQSLVDNGVRSHLSTFLPTISPQIWTTMVTGKDGEHHGITGFTMRKIPGAGVYVENLKLPSKMFVNSAIEYLLMEILKVKFIPVDNSYRKEKALWNIFSEQGLSSGFINWWATWPVEPISGLIVSGRIWFEKFAEKEKAFSNPEGMTCPDEIFRDIESLIISPEEIEDATYLRYLDISPEEIEYMRNYQHDPDNPRSLASEFAFVVSLDVSTKKIALHLLENNPDIPFWAIYINAADLLSHIGMRYSIRVNDPETSEEERGKYGRVIDRIYMDHDLFLGEVMKSAGENALFIIVSDHGFEKQIRGGNEEYGHDFAPPGVLVMSGPPIKNGSSLDAPSVYDVTKNLLYLAGLPVADDMTGRVWTEAYTEEFANANPLRTIQTYGPHTPVEYQEGSPDVNDKIKDHLRAMGYIK
jgi:predicted AlkP superfamily phosphohydrolase/phosphomutase